MWGFGGRCYWGSRERAEGVVVAFAWMSSQDKHLRSYVQLYESLGWDSLVCHSQLLNMFFPDKALPLAVNIVKQLISVVRIKACPIVFAAFSGGPKACMAQVLEVLDGKFDMHLNKDDIRLVKNCISGFIYDSSPVDFTSEVGARFVVHPTILKISNPPRFAQWVANNISSGLDSLFLSRFESQRAEYWQTLYSTTSMRVPYLILCSENDDLAPYQTIHNFSQRLQDLGSDVKMVTWKGSPHVGHYRHYPVDYKAAVTELLGKAAALYSQTAQQVRSCKVGFDGHHDEISDPIAIFKKEAAGSSRGSHSLGLTLSNQILLPSSIEHYDGKGLGSVQDEHNPGVVHLPSLPSINAHGLLGQILFDACVPKNVDDWDIRQSPDAYYSRSLSSTRRHSPFNPMKCIRRSRL
ncbi:hypothetical protein MLD38_034450 [Melastoma candidum]|uniref:Uncharacterized protein n=1 Tax=Melastoma candidum TaxID=119954 RepID=A0ACB9M9Y0_9MYRT|nr:hypothetical protein MLD38_034450 [Melastoma candidum]